MIFRKNEPFVLVIELIRSHVQYQEVKLKPGVGLAATLARYVVRCTAYLLVKILAKEQRSICTSAVGKIRKAWEEEVFRAVLHNCSAEAVGKSYKLMWVVIHRDTGDVFVTSSYAMTASTERELFGCDLA